MCADCDLESYPSYGGAWQRTVRDSGRVGSIYDPGGSRASDLSARASSEESSTKSGVRPKFDTDEDEIEPFDDTQPRKESENAEKDRDKLKRDETELQEMQKRFRELDLQDINFQGPVENPEDWR